MRKRNVFASIVAVLLLGGAMGYYNFIDKSVEADVQVGDKMPNFIAQPYKYDGESFSMGGVYTLANTEGKICVLNMWDITCAACVQELPSFDTIQKEYAEDVAVIAVAGVYDDHTNEERVNWLNTKGWEAYSTEADWRDFSLTLAYLPAEECKKLGCTQLLPHTLIIDEDGTIVQSKGGKMTYDELKTVIDGLLQDNA